MNSFEYSNPVTALFGIGVFSQAGQKIAQYGKKALVVSYSDKGCAATLDKLSELFKAAGVEEQRFCEVMPNPDSPLHWEC